MLDMTNVENPMTQQEAKEWAEALRSGAYKQTSGALKDGNGYCCLGVEWQVHPTQCANVDDGQVASLRYYNEDGSRDQRLRLPGQIQSKLMNMNDDDGKSFFEIADYIEQELIPLLPE